ncbi:CYTH and CHAD domain-containing protein [Microvirga terrestris]|uniref:CHAD domain-containing protein n=1 Tax=Microvirga terrestris TaxID=2791024 RepID=A0ABS0HUD5_9HYPH|nr:CYTH and CHAD domain-containing protein [Microvirga terrestris]MBF9197111.1 CHAD domain-containing protein [Microvirga terrestris]
MSASKERSKQNSGADAPREIELKLELASGTTEDLLAHALLDKARPLPKQSGQLHAVYFDTDDHALHREGISLRIRRRNGKAIQTIKAEGPHKGIAMDRGEWETPVDGELDLSAASGTPLGKLIADGALVAHIKPAFTVETERRAFEAKFDGAVIEVALDRAAASGGGETVTFSEVELELRQGHAGALFGLARRLSEAAPLRLSTVAKSERGYRLLDEDSLRPARAEKINLSKDATCAEAFQIIARSCLAQMVQNEALVRLKQDPDALHQMRVGLRRLRAAISLFRAKILTDAESTEIRNNLRWAGQALGAPRDLDVFIKRLGSMEDAVLDPSQMEEIERRRTEAYRDLLRTLESRRFMDIILQAAAWIEAGAWMASGKGGRQSARERPARNFAEAELSRRFKRIRKLAKHLRDVGDEERHELRIRIKKLRYGTEFFASLFTSGKAQKRRKTFSSLLEELQESLGELNDLAVGGSLALYLPEVPPKRLKQQREKLLDKSETALAALSTADPFWL